MTDSIDELLNRARRQDEEIQYDFPADLFEAALAPRTGRRATHRRRWLVGLLATAAAGLFLGSVGSALRPVDQNTPDTPPTDPRLTGCGGFCRPVIYVYDTATHDYIGAKITHPVDLDVMVFLGRGSPLPNGFKESCTVTLGATVPSRLSISCKIPFAVPVYSQTIVTFPGLVQSAPGRDPLGPGNVATVDIDVHRVGGFSFRIVHRPHP